MAKLTAARRRALEVVAAAHPGPANRSNVTKIIPGTTTTRHFVYWQSADSLAEDGFVRIPGWSDIYLTEGGISLCRELGIELGGC